MRSLVRDLHLVKARVFWADLLASTAAGWSCFVLAIILPPFSAGMLLSTAVAMFALYRALCFIHEISHQNKRNLPGFEAVWNWIVGFPLLMPTFMYVGVHNDHHKVSLYGTSEDPEYLPFAHSRGMTIAFAAESVLIPAALLFRFLILTPIGLVSRRFQNWLAVHASSLTINLRYSRRVSDALLTTIRGDSIRILLLWAGFAVLLATRIVPLRALAVWFAVSACASFVNTMRTLGAHAYESSGEPLDRMGQLVDSIDTPGHFWTELWAPVGLRYHALHHYFPGIPYHGLPEAYRRLSGTLPIGPSYLQMSSPSLPHSLRSLLHKASRTAKPNREQSKVSGPATIG